MSRSRHRRPAGRRRPWKRWIVTIWLLALATGAAWWFYAADYAVTPSRADILNRTAEDPPPTFDVWGRSVSHDEVVNAMKTIEGMERFAPGRGAVALDQAFMAWPQRPWLGRETFYRETFGNEVFFTDLLGLWDGLLSLKAIIKAVILLRGRPTTDLTITVDQPVMLGGRELRPGDLIHTGLDVPKGAWLPLGVSVDYRRGRVRAGLTCAACHSTVDGPSGMVIEGAPNRDLRLGQMLALGVNSAAAVSLTDRRALDGLPTRPAAEGQEPLPEPAVLEQAVDQWLLEWPSGLVDLSPDFQGNAVRIPDTFTNQEYPYGTTGWAMAGPFKGLGVLHHLHGLWWDVVAMARSPLAPSDMPAERQLAMALERAPRPLPEEWSRRAGLGDVVEQPGYPEASAVAPAGVFLGSPGHKVWEQSHALAEWMNQLRAPAPRLVTAPDVVDRGGAVFQRAGCAQCHTPPAHTNHRVIPVPIIGTDGAAAGVLAPTASRLGPPITYAFDTPVPVPPDANRLPVPMDRIDAEQMSLAWGHTDDGGYKVPGLVGLEWRPPYLHDGGVAVGPDAAQAGVPATLFAGVEPDPANSLRALVDPALRRRVIDANAASEPLSRLHVRGVGHEYWVDPSTGFTEEEQQALIAYLLTLSTATEAPHEPPTAPQEAP